VARGPCRPLSVTVGGREPELRFADQVLGGRAGLAAGSVAAWHPDHVETVPVTDGDLKISKKIFVTASDVLAAEITVTNTSPSYKAATVTVEGTAARGAQVTSRDKRIEITDPWVFPGQLAHVYCVIGAAAETDEVKTGEYGYRANYELELLPRSSRTLVAGMAVGFELEGARAALEEVIGNRRALADHTAEWNRFFRSEVPAFESNDPRLDKLYYYRWYSLRAKMIRGGFGNYSGPACREDLAGANRVTSLAAGPSMAELRWLADKSWAWGTARTLLGNLTPEGSVPGSVPYFGTSREPPYHNFVVKAVCDLYSIDPDRARVEELRGPLASNIRAIDPGEGRLAETGPASDRSGFARNARFLYLYPLEIFNSPRFAGLSDDFLARRSFDVETGVFHRSDIAISHDPAQIRADAQGDRRLVTVDLASFLFQEFRAWADLLDVLDDPAAADFRRKAEVLQGRIRASLWDAETSFFHDAAPDTLERIPVKTIFGFYPFWAGVAGADEIGAFDHLFSKDEFLGPNGLPLVSFDYPKRAELLELAFGGNGGIHPAAMCFAVDAALEASKALAPGLAKKAAGLLNLYVALHFAAGKADEPTLSDEYDELTGIPQRPGLDSARSYFADLVMRHVAGIEVGVGAGLRLVPADVGLDHFRLSGLVVKGHELRISFVRPRTPDPYGDGPGFRLWVDGELIEKKNRLEPIETRLEEARPAAPSAAQAEAEPAPTEEPAPEPEDKSEEGAPADTLGEQEQAEGPDQGAEPAGEAQPEVQPAAGEEGADDAGDLEDAIRAALQSSEPARPPDEDSGADESAVGALPPPKPPAEDEATSE
jgi:hypothetical protein